VFLLCGIIPYSFFSIAWISGTTSLVENAHLIKRVPVPREVIPLAAVLSNCLHLIIQLVLLFIVLFFRGKEPNRYWLWLPFLLIVQVIFVCGLSLITAAVNVYVRDMRYVVESCNTVLFWLVPIFYSFAIIPQQYSEIYQLNPVAALVLCLRSILLEARPPLSSTLVKLASVSFLTFGIGLTVFRRLKQSFYNYL